MCSREDLPGLAQSVFFAGFLCGSFVWGAVADWYVIFNCYYDSGFRSLMLQLKGLLGIHAEASTAQITVT